MSSIPTSSRAAWLALVARLHFYIGLFIAPFIFFAALSGTWYVIAPNIEKTCMPNSFILPVKEKRIP